jgi:precorrin-8X/cobalt-precorrin-8 methylmutase
MSITLSEDILAESFRIIDAEVGEHTLSATEWPVARRMIHACGDVDLVRHIYFGLGAAAAGVRAFKEGIPIVTDVRMVAVGIQAPARLALHVDLHCFIDDPEVSSEAKMRGMTRSACAMERALGRFPEAVYVVGNAPTALVVLTAAVRRGLAKPKLILAMPVGFVGVAESKDEAMKLTVPVMAVRERKGGSAIAAAAVNALLLLAREETPP